MEGWLSALDFAAIASILAAQFGLEAEGDLAEIGVCRGNSAVLLSLLSRTGELLYAVDSEAVGWLALSAHRTNAVVATSETHRRATTTGRGPSFGPSRRW